MTVCHKGYATTSCGQMHYVEAGKGPPLVLLGETPRRWRFFVPILPLLAPSARAIAFDMPGLGESHGLPEPMSIEATAACVADALDRQAEWSEPGSLHRRYHRSHGNRPRQQEARCPAAVELQDSRSSSRTIKQRNVATG